jgi:hypothetical protein
VSRGASTAPQKITTARASSEQPSDPEFGECPLHSKTPPKPASCLAKQVGICNSGVNVTHTLPGLKRSSAVMLQAEPCSLSPAVAPILQYCVPHM